MIVWVVVLLFLFNAASLLACVWLVRHAGRGQRWLNRQLWHLALADSFHCFGTLVGCVLLWCFSHVNSPVFNVVWFAFWCDAANFSGIASVTFDAFIAAGFVGVYWRWRGLLKLLGRLVMVPWVLSFVVAVRFRFRRGYNHPFEMDHPADFCGADPGNIWRHQIGRTGLIVALVSVALYLFAAVRAMWYPKSLRQRPSIMVWLYPLAAFATFGSCVALPEKLSLRSGVCTLTTSLSGVVNCLVYVGIDYFASRRQVSRVSSLKDRVPRVFDEWLGVEGLPVGFSLEHDELPLRHTRSRAARRRSERETAELDASREDSDTNDEFSSTSSSSFVSLDDRVELSQSMII